MSSKKISPIYKIIFKLCKDDLNMYHVLCSYYIFAHAPAVLQQQMSNGRVILGLKHILISECFKILYRLELEELQQLLQMVYLRIKRIKTFRKWKFNETYDMFVKCMTLHYAIKSLLE